MLRPTGRDRHRSEPLARNRWRLSPIRNRIDGIEAGLPWPCSVKGETGTDCLRLTIAHHLEEFDLAGVVPHVIHVVGG